MRGHDELAEGEAQPLGRAPDDIGSGLHEAIEDALSQLRRHAAPPVADAFAAHGPIVLFNYPRKLHPAERTVLLPPHAFLDSLIRTEEVPDDVTRWFDGGRADPRPIVYVSLGSFLSARADVLARVAQALSALPVRVVLATGSADPGALGPLPGHWLVRSFLPQIAVLEHAALAVSHGGNNTVTEALSFDVPLLVLPFSTDQFAGAAALEMADRAEVLDPNRATVEQLRAAVQHQLSTRVGS